MAEAVRIVGIGACTPLGRGAWRTAAAVRAGIAAFAEHPFMIDTAGEPMRMALAPWLDVEVQGADRFEALLFPAVDEALEAVPGASPGRDRWALALGLPSPRPGLPTDLASALRARLRQRYGGAFGSVAIFEAGHAAGLLALQAAMQKLRSGSLDGCVVAGVESWIEPETLDWLEHGDQLHSAGPFNNAWGFVPGEAGAALVVVRAGIAARLGAEPLATMLGVGAAHEAHRIKTETVCLGEGLTAAFLQALATLPAGARVTDVYGDMNGEPYRADEFGFAALRTQQHFEALSAFHAPADAWGDVSAAAGPLHLALACAAARKGCARGPYAFAWASAEMGERAAALMVCAKGV